MRSPAATGAAIVGRRSAVGDQGEGRDDERPGRTGGTGQYGRRAEAAPGGRAPGMTRCRAPGRLSSKEIRLQSPKSSGHKQLRWTADQSHDASRRARPGALRPWRDGIRGTRGGGKRHVGTKPLEERRTYPGNPVERGEGAEGALPFAIGDDPASKGRADSGEGLDLSFGGTVEVEGSGRRYRFGRGFRRGAACPLALARGLLRPVSLREALGRRGLRGKRRGFGGGRAGGVVVAEEPHETTRERDRAEEEEGLLLRGGGHAGQGAAGSRRSGIEIVQVGPSAADGGRGHGQPGSDRPGSSRILSDRIALRRGRGAPGYDEASTRWHRRGSRATRPNVYCPFPCRAVSPPCAPC